MSRDHDHDHDHDHVSGHASGPGARPDWPRRLGERFRVGDEAGAWAVVEAALASGWAPDAVLLDVLGPAHQRVLAARFRPRGRRRSTVVLGGQAVRNAEVAALTGATAWAPDGRRFVELVESLVPASRHRAARLGAGHGRGRVGLDPGPGR